MTTLELWKKQKKTHLLIVMGGIFMYILLLFYSAPITPEFSWRYDYVLTPLLFALLYKGTDKLKKENQWALCFSFTLILYGIILSEIWGLGSSSGSILAGKLPYSDAFGYLEGSIRLLNGEPLSVWTSRRPLATSWISLNFFFFGKNLEGALASMAFFCSLGIVFFTQRIRHNFGSRSAWIAHLLLFLFYRNFAGTTLSEQVGFFLGCLAFSLLWESIDETDGVNDKRFLIGLFTLSLGLLARAGTFFILPTLTLWYATRETQNKSQKIKKFLLASCIILLAFGANRLILQTVGISQAAFGNFSHTLYGLVHGGDWTQATSDHPEILSMLEIKKNKYIYDLAIKRIQEQPVSLAKGALRAYRSFFFSSRGAYSFVTSSLSSFNILREVFSLRQQGVITPIIEHLKKNPKQLFYIVSAIPWFVISSLLAFYGCIHALRTKTPQRKMILWVALGILLSIPFLPPWDAQNMRAYAVSIPFFVLFPAYALMSNKIKTKEKTVKWEPDECIAVFICLLLILFPLWMKMDTDNRMALIPSPLNPEKEIVKIIQGSVITPEVQTLFQTDLPPLITWLEDDMVQAFKQLKENMHLAIAYFPEKGTIRYVYWTKNQGLVTEKWIEVKKEHSGDDENGKILKQLKR